MQDTVIRTYVSRVLCPLAAPSRYSANVMVSHSLYLGIASAEATCVAGQFEAGFSLGAVWG